MFWLDRLMRFWRPMPPMPTPAMFSRSLGGVNPRPRTCLGTSAAAAPPAATLLRNFRRVSPFFSLVPLSAWTLVSFFSSFISSLINLSCIPLAGDIISRLAVLGDKAVLRTLSQRPAHGDARGAHAPQERFDGKPVRGMPHAED